MSTDGTDIETLIAACAESTNPTAKLIAALARETLAMRGAVGGAAKGIEAVAGTLAEHGAALAAIRSSNTGASPRAAAPATGGGSRAKVPDATGAEWWFGTGSKARVRLGRDKDKAIDTVADLSWWRKVCEENANNPDKARWRDQNREELAEVDREIARREAGPAQTTTGGGGGYDTSALNAPPADAPPDFGGAPVGDDDIPFVTCGGVR